VAGTDQPEGTSLALRILELGFLLGESGFLLSMRAQTLGQRMDHAMFSKLGSETVRWVWSDLPGGGRFACRMACGQCIPKLIYPHDRGGFGVEGSGEGVCPVVVDDVDS
jgi:hypothetical protein